MTMRPDGETNGDIEEPDEIGPEAAGTMSGVGVQTDGDSIEGLGYTGEGDTEPDASDDVPPEGTDTTEESPVD